jgi:hypothetical protein
MKRADLHQLIKVMKKKFPKRVSKKSLSKKFLKYQFNLLLLSIFTPKIKRTKKLIKANLRNRTSSIKTNQVSKSLRKSINHRF